jgi:putrescine transport system substrate-binding protein
LPHCEIANRLASTPSARRPCGGQETTVRGRSRDPHQEVNRIMRKTILLSTAALAAMAIASGSLAQERVVNIYNWSDYIDETILEEFTAETGIKVVYDVFDSNEMLETKLLAGASGYDIVVPTHNFLARQIEAGVYQKLDKSKLPNLANAWDVVYSRMAKFDPNNDYSVNWMWGTVGIGYNTKKIQEALGLETVDSWDVFYKPENVSKLADCGVYVLDSPSDMIPTTLKYLGLNPESTDAADFAKVEEALLAVRPSIRKFHSSEYINALANGDICLAIGWSGDVFQAADRAAEADQGVEIRYVVPKEGAEMWFDQMAIPADAKNVAEAHEFLNFILKPEIAAKATNYVYFPNGNKASQEFIDKEIIEDPAIYPDEATLQNLFTVLPYDSRTQRQVTRLWTKVVTGQ